MSKFKISSESTLFVISAPSGAGKTTLVERLLRQDRRLVRTISHTTRSPRPRECHGRHYYFVTDSVFDRMIERGELLEWAGVYSRRYGTSKKMVERPLRSGKDVVLIIEEKGARSIRKAFGRKAVFVLILPPSMRELESRIRKRAGMSPTLLRRRLLAAREEIAAMGWYDYVVVNDRLEVAVRELGAIVDAERHRLSRLRGRLGD